MYSRENLDKTRLVKFYLKAMATYQDHFPLLQLFISDLNMHIAKYGSNTNHPTRSFTSIYEYLISIKAPERFIISSSTISLDTNTTPKCIIVPISIIVPTRFTQTQISLHLNTCRISSMQIPFLQDIKLVINDPNNIYKMSNQNSLIESFQSPPEY